MTNKYLPKFLLYSDESLKGYEALKIFSEVKKDRISARTIVACFFVAMVIVFIVFQLGG